MHELGAVRVKAFQVEVDFEYDEEEDEDENPIGFQMVGDRSDPVPLEDPFAEDEEEEEEHEHEIDGIPMPPAHVIASQWDAQKAKQEDRKRDEARPEIDLARWYITDSPRTVE